MSTEDPETRLEGDVEELEERIEQLDEHIELAESVEAERRRYAHNGAAAVDSESDAT